MTSRLKEDERNEKTIRSLLKLPENRRCINCNSLGPQYVCINFWTFVCTTCSGIHREFTHRVKSVSMSKFTSQEVSALQGGGNASAKEIYFREWDPQRQSLPDSSNIKRLREFIRHVYVDKRYIGERSFDKDLSERQSFNGRNDVSSLKNSNEERRFENGSKRDEDVTSPPVIRPPKVNGPTRTQRSVSSSSLPSINKNPLAEVKTQSSLIDFDAVPEPNSNWASFDSIQQVKTSHTPSNTNLLDVLSELSVPASLPITHSTFADGGHYQNVNQAFNQVDIKSTAKKELPVDLFTINYSSFPASQYGTVFSTPPQYGTGFNMQYNVPVHMPPAYLQQSRPSTPFHVYESSSIQPTTFPSMVPLQGALPNMAPPSGIQLTSSLNTFSPWMPTQSSSSIQHTSSLGTHSPAWMPTQPPYGQFMGQAPPNMPPQPSAPVGGFGLYNTSFGSFNHNQQQSEGNPFG